MIELYELNSIFVMKVSCLFNINAFESSFLNEMTRKVFSTLSPLNLSKKEFYDWQDHRW